MDAIFGKLKITSLKDSFVSAILEKILSGELRPGDRLPAERELSEQMGISRSSVNQGIMELESKGFLTIIPRKGTVVRDYRKHPTPQTLAAIMGYGSAEMDHELFSDMMATRSLIETECARLACENIYETTLAEMQDLVDKLAAEPENHVDNLYQFHYRLTQASGNTIYMMIYRGFEPVLRCLMAQHYIVGSSDLAQSAALHQALLDAIRAKNSDLAQKCIRDVLRQGVVALEKRYNG